MPAYGEPDFKTGVFHSINAVGRVLIGRTRILRQNGKQSVAAIGRDALQKPGRDVYLQKALVRLQGKTAGGIGMGIDIGQIRLDIIDGGVVHQISARHMKNGTEGALQLNAFKAHG